MASASDAVFFFKSVHFRAGTRVHETDGVCTEVCLICVRFTSISGVLRVRVMVHRAGRTTCTLSSHGVCLPKKNKPIITNRAPLTLFELLSHVNEINICVPGCCSPCGNDKNSSCSVCY